MRVTWLDIRQTHRVPLDVLGSCALFWEGSVKPACDLCLGTGMLEFGDETPVENSCPRCKPWGDSASDPDDCIDSGGFTPWGSPIMVPVPRCAQCRDLMREHESGAACDRCDRENIQRDEDPDFTLDDLEWSEEHQ